MVHYYTNIKQSKKLIELGLNSETAYMVYRMEFNPYDNVYVLNEEYTELLKFSSDFLQEDVPCWSLGALLGMMPIFDEQNATLECCTDETGKVFSYNIEYQNIKNIGYYKTSIETAYNMIIWLLENNYFKK